MVEGGADAYGADVVDGAYCRYIFFDAKVWVLLKLSEIISEVYKNWVEGIG